MTDPRSERVEHALTELEQTLNVRGSRGSEMAEQVVAILADWTCRFSESAMGDEPSELNPTAAERVLCAGITKLYRSLGAELTSSLKD